MVSRTFPKKSPAPRVRDKNGASEPEGAPEVGKLAKYATKSQKDSAKSCICRVLYPKSRVASLPERQNVGRNREVAAFRRVPSSANGPRARLVDNKVS